MEGGAGRVGVEVYGGENPWVGRVVGRGPEALVDVRARGVGGGARVVPEARGLRTWRAGPPCRVGAGREGP